MTDTGDPVRPGEAGPQLSWRPPVHFHSLGLELPEEERPAHLAEIAAEIWPGGTEYQRTTVRGWYEDIAASAAADGAEYAGLYIGGTDDDRLTTATLVVRTDPADARDPDAVAAALEEMLSNDSANQVLRQEAPAGPVVVVVSGLLVTLPDEETGDRVELPLCTVTAHLPVAGADLLLTMQLSTPSAAEFPDYVALLASTVETVSYGEDPAEAGSAAQSAMAAGIEEAFG
ncbi:hypothetical protein [Peterkaempfera sp. SMS 1(5)a]|uniref:hypothetical protein n=1 Tax=Peterkaempfera podocarpi TaxID=3232308 RepID=UPI003672BCB4